VNTSPHQAGFIPVRVPAPVFSVTPVTLAIPERAVELQMRISARIWHTGS
jgi:hypothetical protein